MNGSRSLGYTEKSQGRVTSLTSTWSEAVCFLVPRLAAATSVALGGSAAGRRSSTERPCGRGGPRWPRPTATRTATTLENGEKATPVTYTAAGAWRGGAGVARCREKRRRLHTARPTPPLKPARGALLAPCAWQRLAAVLGGLPHRKCHGCLHRATPALLAPRRCRARCRCLLLYIPVCQLAFIVKVVPPSPSPFKRESLFTYVPPYYPTPPLCPPHTELVLQNLYCTHLETHGDTP